MSLQRLTMASVVEGSTLSEYGYDCMCELLLHATDHQF